ncbi:MAG: AAA family ATPase, partial [Erysipelotrichaceae bacterium]
MFLKRMEIQGFKSFADKTVIDFEHEVIGIVGPNGCGKSNITDAIRWVLGEQSVKSLRGSNMSDVIFAGSTERKPVNMAQVTLVFDNSKRYLAMDFNEIEITRRMFRMSGENEYFLNKTPCRLKDVIALITDSGLGRDSLSVISQGNISSFAESKPEERRAIFEEAAGVAKYKKRKMESLGKLERTQENLARLQDIATELERQVKPLANAAKKANLYLTKKVELEKVEISVIVDDVEGLMQSIEQDNNAMFGKESEKALAETSLQLHEQKIQQLREQNNASDLRISKLQEELMDLLETIRSLEARKVELDEKRKYQLESADMALKAQTLQTLLQEAQYEYADRKARLQDMQNDAALSQKRLTQLQEEVERYQNEHQQAHGNMQSLKNHISVLENVMKQPFNAQAGVKAILDAHLDGVYGSVSQLVHPQSSFEQAISSALGGTMFHLVCENEAVARKGIHYLKKNKSGRATFLPLDVLKPNEMGEDALVIANSTPGFLGLAKDFVHVESKAQSLLNHLLANICIVQDLVSGNELARRLKYNYKIITLDGDAINKGGSMTGGYHRQNASPLTMQSQLEEAKGKYELAQKDSADLQTFLDDALAKVRKEEAHSVQLKVNMAQLTTIVDAKRSKYESLLADMESMKPYLEGEQEEGLADELVTHLAQAYSQKDALQNSIKAKREERFRDSQELGRKEEHARVLRSEINEHNERLRQIELRMTKSQSRVDYLLERLSNVYEMSYEYAQEQKMDLDMEQAKHDVNRLRSEIQALGNVNLDAPQEYEEVKERYDTMSNQIVELEKAKSTILRAIDEMDETMSTQFM